MKKYFTIEEVKEDIAETLEWYTGYYCDLHGEVFNSSYYIVGYATAKEALEQYGVFDAIEKIQEYEKERFGEILTDLSDPEKIANMLYYVLGDEYMFYEGEFAELLSDHWNEAANEEVNEQLIEALELE